MIPAPDRKPRRVQIKRNRECFLLGASWSHHHSFSARRTHFYFGWWVLTLTTGVA